MRSGAAARGARRDRAQVAHERPRLAHERADVVAQLRRRLLGERAHRLVGGGERARRRAQLLGRRAEQLGERARRASSVSVVCDSVLGSSLHGGGDVGLLLGERVEARPTEESTSRGEVVVVLGELAVERMFSERDEVAQVACGAWRPRR